MISVTNNLYIKQNGQGLDQLYLDLANADNTDPNPRRLIINIFKDCYKTEDIGTYGTLVYLEKPSSGNYIEKTAIDGTIFYVPA